MKHCIVEDNFKFLQKSKYKASDGQPSGKYPFYTCSDKINKFIDINEIKKESLIFGTGGKAVIHHSLGAFSTSADCLVMQAKDESEINLKFAYLFLKNNIHILEEGFRGAGLKHISKKYISQIKIPLPPLPIQKKIVQVLDKAQQLIDLREKQLLHLDELVQSVFYDMFGDPVTNPKGWEELELHFIAKIVSGVTKGRKFKDKVSVYTPYMRVANVQDGYLMLDDIAEIEVLLKDIDTYRLLAGDLLLTEGGDPDKLGRGAIWPGTIKNCIHQNHIFRVRLDQSKMIPIFGSALISSSRCKRFFLRAAKQTTGIASINMTQLKRCPMLLPPITLQNDFAEKVQKIEAQKAIMQESLGEMKNNYNSLIQRAFKGELFKEEALV